jgi:hypothetical protein
MAIRGLGAVSHKKHTEAGSPRGARDPTPLPEGSSLNDSSKTRMNSDFEYESAKPLFFLQVELPAQSTGDLLKNVAEMNHSLTNRIELESRNRTIPFFPLEDYPP